MTTERNFWYIKLYPNGDVQWGKELTPWLLEKTGTIGLGEFNGSNGELDKSVVDFRNRVKIGDIVGVRVGADLLALVKVIGHVYTLQHEWTADGYAVVVDEKDERLGWYINRRAVRVLDWNVGGLRPPVPQTRGRTLSFCKDLDAATNKTLVDWYNEYQALQALRNAD